jgi:redox-sensitive bicupin YhaK (pirin superfamily)
MKKEIAVAYHGALSKVGELTVSRLLPNRYSKTVGPFLLLDHLIPTRIEPAENAGGNAHPHRGIATFTYIFNGEIEHSDSRDNHGVVSSGGAQWMKAGNGIIHDENPTRKFIESGELMHGLQFWINLPAKNKAEAPEYLSVQSADFPEIELPENAGVLRVLIGEYEGVTSPVKTFSGQFNYHLKLNPGALFVLKVNPLYESAAFIPSADVHVNYSRHGKGELIVFGIAGNEILLHNPGTEIADIMLFGGETYVEPIVAEGPFVMNTKGEIGVAYADYFNGKYGSIRNN